MLHKHLLDFTRKYNKEFAIKGYSKLKKADLQQKIELVLNKQRKEIKEEYKKLKETKAEPAKKTPVKKPVVKKESKPKPTPVKKAVKKEKGEELNNCQGKIKELEETFNKIEKLNNENTGFSDPKKFIKNINV
eukprot:COSAG02_NODE_32338_length_518_cov_0.594272_1_plen_132_part_10